MTSNRFRNHSVSFFMDSLFGCDFWAKHRKVLLVWSLCIPVHLFWRCSLEHVLKCLGSLRSPQLTGRICLHFQSNYVNYKSVDINGTKGSWCIRCISLPPGTGCRWESLVDPAKPKPVPGILFQHLKARTVSNHVPCRHAWRVYIDMTWCDGVR